MGFDAVETFVKVRKLNNNGPKSGLKLAQFLNG